MNKACVRQPEKKPAKKKEGYYRWLKVNSLLDAGSTLFMSPCGVSPADQRRRRRRRRQRHGPSPPGAASPSFTLATSARTSLPGAQNSTQLLRQDAPPALALASAAATAAALAHSGDGEEEEDDDDGAQRLCRRSRCIHSAVPTPAPLPPTHYKNRPFLI